MLRFLKIFFISLKETRQKNSYSPAYRLVEINQSETADYIVTVQVINKNIIFQAKPEEILANDKLVDQFSPRDVRTLTYLGYLSINNPKYKILAQRLSENSDKVLFAIRKKGEKNVLIKTADEILQEKEILNNLDAKDSHVVGYAIASESVVHEKKLKSSTKE